MLVNDDILQPIFRIKIYSISYLNTIYNVGCIKSFVDDLIWTRYCKHESSLVLRSAEVLPLFIDLCNRFEISISSLITISPPQNQNPPTVVVFGRATKKHCAKPNPHLGTFKFERATIKSMICHLLLGRSEFIFNLHNFLRVLKSRDNNQQFDNNTL